MKNNFVNLSEKNIQQITWTLLCLMPIVGMAVDLIAPSLPSIANNLHVQNNIVKNAISIYLLGYALGNFFIGFLTDALGRKNIIRIGLLGFVIASLMPIVFPRIEILLVSRLLQGITIGGVAVIIRAVFSDILPSEKLVRLGTLLGTMWGLGPVIGPVIGGYLQYHFGWQAVFYFFALLSFIGLIAVFYLIPETHFNRHSLNVKTIRKNFIEVISNRTFMAAVLLMGLTYSLVITFHTIGPFLVQTQLHYSPIFFGNLAFCLGLVFLFSTLICRYLLRRSTVEKLYLIVLHLIFFFSILAVIASYFIDNIVLISIISGIMFFACGFIFPMSGGKGISLFRHISGTASAVMYLINVLLTSLVSFLLSFLNNHSAVPMMWIYCMLLFFCVIIYWHLIRPTSAIKVMCQHFCGQKNSHSHFNFLKLYW